MGTLGMIGAVGIGVMVTLTAPVLVWVLVIKGLRQVSKKDADWELQQDIETRTVGA